MGKADVKIDSWEPAEDHEFKYPKGKEIEKELTSKLIKAFEDGLGDSLLTSE